jgi:hypothetical protein
VVAVVRQMTQLKDNLQSPTLNLTAEQVRKLDEASAILFGFPHDFYRARWSAISFSEACETKSSLAPPHKSLFWPSNSATLLHFDSGTNDVK